MTPMFRARTIRRQGPPARAFVAQVPLALGTALALALSQILALPAAKADVRPAYGWTPETTSAETLAARVAPPPGFERITVPEDSFAHWLRGLPMKKAGAPVLTFTGSRKPRQDVHTDVVDMDVGDRDLQQCADAIMRLRAEWLYGAQRDKEIAFNDTEGKRLRFTSRRKRDYRSLRRYLNYVFAYAGTYSLERELKPVSIADMKIGDVFIRGGFPGHAVLVADMVENPETGEKRFLLLQSYMPAQDVHVLKNPAAADGSPWYPINFGVTLNTPEWVFPRNQLRRWP